MCIFLEYSEYYHTLYVAVLIGFPLSLLTSLSISPLLGAFPPSPPLPFAFPPSSSPLFTSPFLLSLPPIPSPSLPPSLPYSCPYLHRTAGDTERRYHLRYYKTSTCVYETDSRGYCVKNGPHCAFAHGPNDLRPPVYDIRELQGVGRVEDEEGRLVSPLVGSLEKERGVLVEDPRWQG